MFDQMSRDMFTQASMLHSQIFRNVPLTYMFSQVTCKKILSCTA